MEIRRGKLSPWSLLDPFYVFLDNMCPYEHMSANSNDLRTFSNKGQNSNFALLRIYYLFIETTVGCQYYGYKL